MNYLYYKIKFDNNKLGLNYKSPLFLPIGDFKDIKTISEEVTLKDVKKLLIETLINQKSEVMEIAPKKNEFYDTNYYIVLDKNDKGDFNLRCKTDNFTIANSYLFNSMYVSQEIYKLDNKKEIYTELIDKMFDRMGEPKKLRFLSSFDIMDEKEYKSFMYKSNII